MKIVTRLRARIAAWYEAADKSLLANFAFLSAIVLSAILLVGAVGANWWSSTFASAVEVNGASISVGEAKARGEIELFRLGQEGARIRARVSAGTLSSEQGNALLQQINDASTNISSQLTSDMIDVLLVDALAAARGVTATQEEIDAEWAKETTLPELRLLRRITIDIANDPKLGAPSESTIATAKDCRRRGLRNARQAGVERFVCRRGRPDWLEQQGGRPVDRPWLRGGLEPDGARSNGGDQARHRSVRHLLRGSDPRGCS
jgi:hypothetical protein